MRISNTAERLNALIIERGLKQVDILRLAEPYCREFGVSLTKVDLSQYISGRYEPKQVKLNILALALGVSEAWLMGYDVPMERSEPIPPVGTSGDPDIRILERARETMSDADWETMMNVIKAMHPEFFKKS